MLDGYREGIKWQEERIDRAVRGLHGKFDNDDLAYAAAEDERAQQDLHFSSDELRHLDYDEDEIVKATTEGRARSTKAHAFLDAVLAQM